MTDEPRSNKAKGKAPANAHDERCAKRVTNAGTIRLKKRLLFVSNALPQQPVGLEEVDDGVWSIHFCHVLLGRVDERDYVIRPYRPVVKVGRVVTPSE